MELGPYTYVTLSLPKDEAPRVHISFHTSDLRVRSGVLKDRPYLEVSSDEADVLVSSTGNGPITTKDLAVARELFNAAARYLADCERLHTGEVTPNEAAA